MKAKGNSLSPGLTVFVMVGLLTLPSIFVGGAAVYAKTERVAILKSADITPYNQAIEAFKNNLALKDSLIQEYNLNGDLENGRQIAQNIIDSQAELVLAVGLKATLVAKHEIREIPVIFCMVLNPMRFNLEAANLKGISLAIPFKKQILLLQSIVPTVSRIGILYDPEKSGHLVKEAQSQADEMEIELIAQVVSSQKDLPTALREMLPRIHAIWLVPDSTVLTEDSLDFLITETLQKRVPVMGFSSGLVNKGALVGTYIHYEDVGKQAAGLAKDLLLGKSFNCKGIIAPTRFRKAINLNTAHFFGLAISPNILKGFDERY